MSRCYEEFSGERDGYADVVYACKQQVMHEQLAPEIERLTTLLVGIRAESRRDLRVALCELIAGFPVYRTYVQPGHAASAQDHGTVTRALAAASARRPDIDAELLHFLGALALGEHDGAREADFTQRLQQVTGPVMAKGVEDTAFYRYHRLISLNEVGGDPGRFGRSVADFHRETAAAAQAWPHAMLTLSTHDTKRSADVRARVHVLSELPSEWSGAVERWASRNEGLRSGTWPDRNVEYLLYQTLVGAWPIAADRAAAFMAKAVKEAKVHTSWSDPVAEYDGAVESFVRAVLADHDFVDDLEAFLATNAIVARGRRNSLAQTALLLTCPGVPDLYQGSELWDLSLVDPDNRRAVDYERRREILERTRDAEAAEVMGCSDSGAPKQWMIHRLLHHRRREPDRYEASTYEPLDVRGGRAGDVLAFSRGRVVVVVPRLGTGGWRDTSIELPNGSWSNVLMGTARQGGRVALDDLFGDFPVAVLARDGT
jgi:(1->4)-alpha-D-glucan 1-alpha-D-glucosylmutase